MFNGKFKLIATMVGLVAVLAMMLAVPGVTQIPADCRPSYVPCIDRGQLVQGLQNEFSALTASIGDLLDFERAVFWSDGGPRQIAYIPPDPASGLWDRVQQLKEGETVEAPFGGLYIAQWKGAESILGQFPLALKMRLKGNKDQAKVALINAAGEEVLAVPATLDLADPTPCGKPQFSVEVIDHRGGECPFARSRGEALTPGGVCLVVRIRGEAIAGIHLEMTN